MEFDLDRLQAADRYELLLSTIVPRPIALITTLSANGIVNAAPYSLFNVMSHEPPIMAVSVLPHPDRRLKDTGQNILSAEEFVLNLVSETLADAMNTTCVDAPPEVSEIAFTELKTAPSVKIKTPRIASSPVSLECRLLTSMSFGPNQAIILGRIVHVHVADDYVVDASRCAIDTPALKLIGGMHGARWYTRTSDLFAMDRPTWAGWKKDGKV